MQIALRPAVTEDFDYCKRLYFGGMKAIIEELNLDRVAQGVAFQQQWERTEVRIILLDGLQVGWLQSVKQDDALFIRQLFVDGPFQGRGIGTEVMDSLIGEAARDHQAVRLSVVKMNPALRLYKRLGFYITHEDDRKFYMKRDVGVSSATQGKHGKAWRTRIPAELVASCRKSPEHEVWLERLPGILRETELRWSLTPDAPFEGREGSSSYVTPVTRENGTAAVLKLSMPHMEGQHEIQGLRFWDGNPTVRLYEADEDLGAMLLERCRPGVVLRTLGEREQDVVIAALLRRLWRQPPSPHGFRPLSALTEYWSRETLARIEEWPDTGLVREGLRLFHELPRNGPREVLLATDLHAGNVLRAEREPWLVIDPKPFVGDPAYDATQHLFNCQTRFGSQLKATMRNFADLLGVDHERVRLWTFARAAAEPRRDWSNRARIKLARAIAP